MTMEDREKLAELMLGVIKLIEINAKTRKLIGDILDELGHDSSTDMDFIGLSNKTDSVTMGILNAYEKLTGSQHDDTN